MQTTSCYQWLLAACASIALLSACGGGGGSSSSASSGNTEPVLDPNPPGAGQWQAVSFLKTISVAEINRALPAQVGSDFRARYAVDTYRLTYRSSDADGNPVIASALLAVPQKSAGSLSPLLSYQHATIKQNAEAPSNAANPDQVAVWYASLGFIVNAADYVGYGASQSSTHPYLLAKPSALPVLDLLTASTRWRKTRGYSDNGQLFMTGYSEGAYVTLATLKQLSVQSGPRVEAGFIGAGPYNVKLTLDAMLDEVRQQNPALAKLLTPGFLSRLGANDRANLSKLILFLVAGSESDIRFDAAFLSNYLNDDVAAIAAQSDVYDWNLSTPLGLIHGVDDSTVPYANTTSLQTAMNKRGLANLLQSFTCNAKPAEHLACVPDYLSSSARYLQQRAANL